MRMLNSTIISIKLPYNFIRRSLSDSMQRSSTRAFFMPMYPNHMRYKIPGDHKAALEIQKMELNIKKEHQYLYSLTYYKLAKLYYLATDQK